MQETLQDRGPPLERETLAGLFQILLKIRLAEEKIAEIYPTDKILSPIHLSLGQEAIAAGVCHALGKTDHVYGTYRSHGIYLAKGGGLKSLFAELYGKKTGSSGGKGGSMHLSAPEVGFFGTSAIVASTIPVATGDALASSMQGLPRMVAVFFGDGAVDEGVFFESVNFAVLKRLPILYVCENNFLAVNSRLTARRDQRELFRCAEGIGLKGYRFNGNDAATVYAHSREAVESIRRGGPPLLLEFTTRRLREHVGPQEIRYEIYQELEGKIEGLGRDPIERARDLLEVKFGVPHKTFLVWEKGIRQEIEEAVRFAEESSFPDPAALYEDVYGARP